MERLQEQAEEGEGRQRVPVGADTSGRVARPLADVAALPDLLPQFHWRSSQGRSTAIDFGPLPAE